MVTSRLSRVRHRIEPPELPIRATAEMCDRAVLLESPRRSGIAAVTRCHIKSRPRSDDPAFPRGLGFRRDDTLAILLSQPFFGLRQLTAATEHSPGDDGSRTTRDQSAQPFEPTA
jgi:hypothetical protein